MAEYWGYLKIRRAERVISYTFRTTLGTIGMDDGVGIAQGTGTKIQVDSVFQAIRGPGAHIVPARELNHVVLHALAVGQPLWKLERIGPSVKGSELHRELDLARVPVHAIG